MDKEHVEINGAWYRYVRQYRNGIAQCWALIHGRWVRCERYLKKD